MKFDVIHQERYSRGQLLLRAFFGFLYIAMPHFFLLLFVGIAAQVITFIAFWVILFTGSYPESLFEFQVKVMHWNQRVQARLIHLADGYPPFGFDVDDPAVVLEVPYPERLSRGHALIKVFLGWLYCGIPHYFVLFFLLMAGSIVQFIAFWVVLFTAEYPKGMHSFNVGVMRWGLRVQLYLGLMTDDYPPFSLDPEEEKPHNLPPDASPSPSTAA